MIYPLNSAATAKSGSDQARATQPDRLWLTTTATCRPFTRANIDPMPAWASISGVLGAELLFGHAMALMVARTLIVCELVLAKSHQ